MRLHIRENSLLPSSRPSHLPVCPRVSARLQWTDFHEIRYWMTSMKTCWEISNFFNSGRNTGHFTDEDLMTFHCCWRHKLALKRSHAIPCVFRSLTARGEPTTHTERICRSSITKIVTQKRHDASLRAHCPSFYISNTGICYNGQSVAALPTRQMKLFRNMPLRTNASAFCSLTSTTLLLHAMISDLYNSQLELFWTGLH